MHTPIYLDNAASSPMRPEAIAAFVSAVEAYANPSSLHTLGQDVRKRIEKARASVAALIDAEAVDVVFTSGATEANNLAIRGVLEPLLDAGARPHAVTTALEHASVIKTFESLVSRGLELTIVPPAPDGLVRAEDVLAAVREETALVSVIAVSNELGTRQPVEEIGRALEKTNALFHIDAVQALVSTDLGMRSARADLFTVSAHKIGGPKGIGVLAVRKGVGIAPLLTGGGQERGMRSGTENVPGMLGFGAACDALRAFRSEEIERYRLLQSNLFAHLPEGAKPLVAPHTPAAPHVFTLECSGKENDWIVLLLSRAGVMVSAGSACKSGLREASPALAALGFSEARARSIIRLSFGWQTDANDVERGLDALREALLR